MQILNPCRKCILKSICTARCEEKQKFWDIRVEIFEWIERILLVSCVVIILFGGF